jgi:uncharacterized protein (TIGR00730 family)
MLKRVSVYCASSTQIDTQYLNAAAELGVVLVENNVEVVYGGGSVGSMGALADAVIGRSGQLIGVIPKFMMELEWGNPLVSQMIIVESMSERKREFLINVDAVIALPGGTGTLEELSEVISLKKLGLFKKPIVIVNTNGFYDYLLRFLDRMTDDNFIREEHKQLYSVVTGAEEIIFAINNSPDWSDKAIKLAAL